MKPLEFIKKYHRPAMKTEVDTGISEIAIMAQHALESGWGEHSVGNNPFGIKATDSWDGKKQLLKTREVHDNPEVDYPVILSIEKRKDGYYDYKVKDFFRRYDSIEDAYKDYVKIFKNKRYAKAMEKPGNYEWFLSHIADDYATDPIYEDKVLGVAYVIENIIKDKDLEVFVEPDK